MMAKSNALQVRHTPTEHLPMNWRKIQLSGIGAIVSGSTPKTSVPENWNGEIVWLTPEDLSKKKKYYDSSARFISRAGLRSSSAKLIPPHSVVISSRAPVGYLGIPTVPYTTNQGCKSLVPSNEFNSEFVYYALHNCVSEMMRLGSGTTFTEISRSQLESLKVSVPNDKNEQIAIAAVLSRCDATIQWTRSLIKKLQRIKQGLMQDLLTKGIDEHGNIRSEKTHQFKDSALGRIPVEWEVVPLGKLEDLSLIMGQSPDSKSYNQVGSGIPFLQGNAEFTNKYARPAFFTSEPIKIALPNDILISVRAPVGEVNIAPCKLCIGRGLLALRATGGSLLYYFQVMQYYKARIQSMSKGSTFTAVTKNDVENFLISRVPAPEQDRIAATIEANESSLRAEEEYLRKMTSIKRGLMQDLLSGKVRVTPLMDKV